MVDGVSEDPLLYWADLNTLAFQRKFELYMQVTAASVAASTCVSSVPVCVSAVSTQPQPRQPSATLVLPSLNQGTSIHQLSIQTCLFTLCSQVNVGFNLSQDLADG